MTIFAQHSLSLTLPQSLPQSLPYFPTSLCIFVLIGLFNLPVVLAANSFPQPFFVTLKESNQVAQFPEQNIWQGGPKMLYNAITPDGKTLVVSSPKESSIYVFDTHTGKQLGIVKCGKASKGLKISPDGKEVYVSNEGADSISVVDLVAMKVVATIATDDMPHNVRFTKDGKTAYVTLQGGAGLGVIDTHTRKVAKVIPTPGINNPHNLDLSHDESLAFIRGTSGLVGVLDLKSEKIKRVIKVGNGHAGIDVIPNGKLVFTGAIADNFVTVLDAKTFRIIKKIKVGFGPHGVRASKDNRWLYVSITADDQLTVIDTQKLEVVKTHKLASFPFWIAVNGNP